MGLLSFLKIPGAVKEVAGVVKGVVGLFDEFFYTSEEKAKARQEFVGGMSNINWIAQVIRSWRRANLAAWIVKPFIVVFFLNIPIMIWRPDIAQMIIDYLKEYKSLVALVLGPYFGYYGVEQAVKAIRNKQ